MFTIHRVFRTSSLGMLALILAGSALSACGARQGGSGNCPKVKEGISAGAWEEWASCVDDGRIANPDVCRASLAYAQSMTPSAVESATRCVLKAQSRDDGSTIGEAIQRIASHPNLSAGFARGLAPHYSHDIHGGRFASSIGASGERALGQQLGQVPEATRNELLRTAFAWGLQDLAQAGLPYIQDPTLLQSEMETIAQRAQNSRNLSEVERFTLVTTGRWGANDILDCLEGKNRACPGGPTTETLQLLEHDRSPRRNSIAAARVTGTLADVASDNRSVQIVLDWIAAPTTPNSEALMSSLRTSVASTSASQAFRHKVADAANAELCSSTAFPSAAHYAVSSSRTPTPEWTLFLNRCIQNFWRAEDFARVLATGYEINATDLQRVEIRRRLAESLQEGSCQQVEALGAQVASANHARNGKEGIIWAELSALRSDCAASFRAPLQAVVSNAQAHPEARLAGIAALAKQNDKSVCRQIESAQSWNAERTGIPVGRGVPIRLDEARAACR